MTQNNRDLVEVVANAMIKVKLKLDAVQETGSEYGYLNSLVWDEDVRNLAQAAIAALQPQPVNTQLLEALKFYSVSENYNEDYEVNFPFRDTKVNFDRGEIAKQAIASASSNMGVSSATASVPVESGSKLSEPTPANDADVVDIFREAIAANDCRIIDSAAACLAILQSAGYRIIREG